MLSKILKAGLTNRPKLFLLKSRACVPPVRHFGNFVPPSQYSIPWPNNLRLGYAMRVHWEVIPLVATTCASITILVVAIAWACKNKVDAVFTTHSRENISRTMDLRHPTYHKMVVISKVYDPWPEMQDALDKMKAAEKRVKMRAQTCSLVPPS